MVRKPWMRQFREDLFFRNALPLVLRELRAESRRPINYGLRVLAAAVITAVFATFVIGTQLDTSRLGAALFAVLQRALSLAIWIIVPMMTADCISREKREGTLGLLFLTPLTVLDVLMGKAATNILRATTLFLASVPVLVLPFVVGGVAWQQVVLAIAAIANALLLGIAAGLYASAKGGSSIQVMVRAEGYALLLAIISSIGRFMLGWYWMGRPSLFALAWLLGASAGITAILFIIVINAAVRTLRETWDQDAAAPEQPQWVEAFSDSDFWRTVFHWNHGRTLDRNPMAWLQEYSWTARLTKWGWFIAILFAEFFTLVGFPGCQPQLTTALALGVAFSATGSFRRERQSGLLEILLVTPISSRQLIAGRLWGIFSHFFPALIALSVCWNADRIYYEKIFHHNPYALIFPNPLAFVALMIVGLYLSLSRLNFLVVWLLAWTLAFLLPAIASVLLDQFSVMPQTVIIAVTSTYQLALALAAWFLLRRDMDQRNFLEATT